MGREFNLSSFFEGSLYVTAFVLTSRRFIGAAVMTFRSLVRDVDRAGVVSTSFVRDKWMDVTINLRRYDYDGSLDYIR